MSGHNGRSSRSSGELIDLILGAALPPIYDQRDLGKRAVSPALARHVMMVMATFTNPTRDLRVHGEGREWQCWATVATIARLADTTERQVQRVLHSLIEAGYMECSQPGRSSGRPRKGEAPRPGQRAIWSFIKPEAWRERSSINGDASDGDLIKADASDGDFRENGKMATLATDIQEKADATGEFPGKMPTLPVNFLEKMPTLASPQPGSTFNPETFNPETNEPSRARARGVIPEDPPPGVSLNGHTPPQQTLPRTLTAVPALPGPSTPPERCGSCKAFKDQPPRPVCLNREFHAGVPRAAPPPTSPLGPRCESCRRFKSEIAGSNCANVVWHVESIVEAAV